MATRLGGRTLVEYQTEVSACFCYIYIYVEYRVEYEARKCFKSTYIYMRNIVWNIIFIKFHRNTYIYEEHRVEYPNCIWHFEENPTINSTKSHIYIYEEYRVEYHVFAKSFQKSSKNVQPRNSFVEYLWNIKKCSFEGFRSPGGSCLKACSCHVGGWFV